MTFWGGALTCDHCGGMIEQLVYRHTWIGPIPKPGENPRHYHLALEYPQCRAVGSADPMPGELS